MDFGINNFFDKKHKDLKIGHFQDLEHIDGLSISTVSCGLYDKKRDDLVLFYFRDGAKYASVYTQSKILSENIKWNKRIKEKKVFGLLVNTRNANALTGHDGYNSLKKISLNLSKLLSEKQITDEDNPLKIKPGNILFACTGTIGEKFPESKIISNLKYLIERIKYTQNKLIWIKAALGIMTTDTKPKLSMFECKIGGTEVKIYGIAKGSGMVYPNMATTLGFIFTDANISSSILRQILRKNIKSTFNAITCDGDTSTNDMVSIFTTSKASNKEIKSINDPKLKKFINGVEEVMLNLAKRVVSDGEGATKFVSVKCNNSKSEEEAKKVCFSIANSPLVKTAVFAEDPNWGRIAMAVGKSGVRFNIEKLKIFIGKFIIFNKGKIDKSYNEVDVREYMKNENIEITVDLSTGSKEFTAYTMDLSKKYIEINSDYRS